MQGILLQIGYFERGLSKRFRTSVCHSHVLVCHQYVTRIYSNTIRMSLVCTRISFVFHSYVLVCHSDVLVCHPYVTHMYSYVIRMSLVCGFTMNPYESKSNHTIFSTSLIKKRQFREISFNFSNNGAHINYVIIFKFKQTS